MLASIHPLGEQGRRQRWGLTASAYLVATVAAAGLLGALLGQAGAWVRADREPAIGAVVAVLAAVGTFLDLRVGGLGVPTVHRQVDERWLSRYRGWVYGASFGFQLGLGVLTVVNTFAVYLAFALALATGSAVGGLAVGGTFGLVRGASILAGANVRGPEQLRRLHRRLADWDRPSHRLAVGVQAMVAVAGVAAALGR